MKNLIKITASVFIVVMSLTYSFSQAEEPPMGADVYDPNQVRNDDLRVIKKEDEAEKIEEKSEKDKKLDAIVDKFEELRNREEALLAKKEALTKAGDKKGLKDLEDEFEDLDDDKVKVDKELSKLKN